MNGQLGEMCIWPIMFKKDKRDGRRSEVGWNCLDAGQLNWISRRPLVHPSEAQVQETEKNRELTLEAMDTFI